MHDLMLRYKNAAERSFLREYRALEAHYKAHKLTPAQPSVPNPASTYCPELRIVRTTSAEIVKEMKAAREYNPLPPRYP